MNEMTYSEAVKELESIMQELENGEITIDDLESKIKRASELIHFCKDKLKKTELDVELILKELNQD